MPTIEGITEKLIEWLEFAMDLNFFTIDEIQVIEKLEREYYIQIAERKES